MTEESYEQLDDLFKKIILSLVKVSKNDPGTASELKGLIGQLELWVDLLVVDSLRLRSLEADVQKRKELAKRLLGSLDKEWLTQSDIIHPTMRE